MYQSFGCPLLLTCYVYSLHILLITFPGFFCRSSLFKTSLVIYKFKFFKYFIERDHLCINFISYYRKEVINFVMIKSIFSQVMGCAI